MDRVSLLRQRGRAHTPDDFLIMALHYGDLKDVAQDAGTRDHLGFMEQSYRTLANTKDLLAHSAATMETVMHLRPKWRVA